MTREDVRSSSLLDKFPTFTRENKLTLSVFCSYVTTNVANISESNTLFAIFFAVAVAIQQAMTE